MSSSRERKVLYAFVVLLVPIAWLAMKYAPYVIDGDAVSYMDIADLLRAHNWAGAVNGYWSPLYPAGLAITQALAHPGRFLELGEYFKLNYFIFLFNIAAVFAFTSALCRLRQRLMPAGSTTPLLSPTALKLIGGALLVIASQRELSFNRVGPDLLLNALLLLGVAAMLRALADTSLLWPLLMGLSFGLAYLAKSFAFLFALLSISLLVFLLVTLRARSKRSALLSGALAFVVFACIAGPYVAAISRQHHHFDFGDSGSLNYAWYDNGVARDYLEPSTPGGFGTATGHLLHPPQVLLANPGVYGYNALDHGTQGSWFDASFWYAGLKPNVTMAATLVRVVANIKLAGRYLLNHPEALLLLALFLLLGARWPAGPARNQWRSGFWIAPVLLGLALWAIYGIVNIEERYVTAGYILILIPLFAMLQVREVSSRESTNILLPSTSFAVVAMLAFLTPLESLRMALENRRLLSIAKQTTGWANSQEFAAGRALQQSGIRPGDSVACLGSSTCSADPYWARLARARILTAIAGEDAATAIASWKDPQLVYDAARSNGAQVIVGQFDPGHVAPGWIRLGNTSFYALPLANSVRSSSK